MTDLMYGISDIFSGSPSTWIQPYDDGMRILFRKRPLADIVYSTKKVLFEPCVIKPSFHGPRMKRLVEYLISQGYSTNLSSEKQ